MLRDTYLVQESFEGFEDGAFPYDKEHSALGEYHLYKVPGKHGIWNDPVCNYEYQGPSWMIVSKNGKKCMEQMRVDNTYPHIMHPILMTGDILWKNYTMEATVRIYNTSGSVGVAVCVQNSLHLLAIVLEQQHIRLYRRHKQIQECLAEAPFTYDCDHFYMMKAVLMGKQIQISVDGILLIEVENDIVSMGGKIGLTADRPAAYTDIAVKVSSETMQELNQILSMKHNIVSEKCCLYPPMKLWKKIDLQNFGCGRQIRFGHLCSKEKWNIVFAQCQKRIYKDAYASISCLTAIDLEGNILWQWGSPVEDEEAGMLSADLPFQIYDFDGDGLDEVIFARDFELLILDGANGEIIRRASTPLTPEPHESLLGVPYNRYAFDRLNVDCIRICNISGKERPTDILIKDRYSRLYALDKDFRLLWKYQDLKNTGHFPYPHDFNGDGRDEIFCGYNMLSADGELIWSLPLYKDHTDEIIIGKFRGDGKGYLALACGSDGINIVDLQGNLIFQDDIGHAQRISIGSYVGVPGKFAICAVNYWGHQGIVYFYDSDGNLIWEKETGLNGQILTPVNWKGDGTDLILLNGDEEIGGLMDGDGDIVVHFPKDNHPQLCVEAIDLCGDNRDEIVVWDRKQMYIYTQADEMQNRDYQPVRYPLYAMSNYRGEYSYPSAEYITFNENLIER